MDTSEAEAAAAAAAPEASSSLPEELVFDAYRTNEFFHSAPCLPRELLSQIQFLREEQFLIDVVVCVGGERFPCHKLLLAASSSYFKAWFQHDQQVLHGREITVGKITPRGFAPILDFIYTSVLHITTDNVVDVLDAADFLQFRDIAELCCRMLLQHISTNNCLSLQQLGEAHLYPALASAAKEYALEHFSHVARTSDFLRMSPGTLEDYLSSRELHVQNEADLLKAIVRWVEFDTSREHHLDNITQLIDVHSINPDVLQEMVSGETPDAGVLIRELTEGRDVHKPQTPGVDCDMMGRQTYVRPQPVMVVWPTNVCHKDKKPSRLVHYYDFQQNTWKVLTTVPFTDRSYYSVTNVDNAVFVVGGEQKEISIKEVVKYSVSNNSWEAVQPLLRSRSNHSAVSTGGKLYVVGGAGPTNQQLRKDGEVYDPRTGQWTMLAELLDVEGIGHCALVPLDGKLYAFGGTQSYFNQQTGDVQKKQYLEAQFFDVESEKWYRSPRLTHNISSKFQLSISVGDGDGLPYRGCILIFDENLRGRRIRLFNPVTEVMTDFVSTHGGHKFGGYVIFNDVLYCSGGMFQQLAANDMVHSMSLQDNSSGWRMLASLPFGISHHSAFVVFKTPHKNQENTTLDNDDEQVTL